MRPPATPRSGCSPRTSRDPIELSIGSFGHLTTVVIEGEGRELARWSEDPARSVELTVRAPDALGPADLHVQATWEPAPSRYTVFALRGLTTERVPVRVQVRSRPAVVALRLGNAVLAAMFWLQATVAVAWSLPRVEALDRQPDRNLNEGVAGALCVALVLYALAGYWLFVLPLAAATGWTGTLATCVALGLWTAGVGFAGFRLARVWARHHRFTLRLEQPADPDVVAERLRGQGLRARALMGRLWVRDASGPWLWVAGLGAGGTPEPVTTSERLTLQVALALGRPASVCAHGTWVHVGPEATLEALQAELSARRRAEAEAVLEALRSFADPFEPL